MTSIAQPSQSEPVVWRWIGANYFGLIGLLSLVDGVSGVFWVGVLAQLVCAPPLRRRIMASFKFELTGAYLALACVLLFFAQAAAIVIHAGGKQVQREAAAAAAPPTEAQIVSRDAEHFAANKAAVLKEIAALRDTGELLKARAMAIKYGRSVNDPDLKLLRAAVVKAHALAELKSDAALPLERRATLYASLAESDPKNKQYAAKSRALTAQLKQQQEEEARRVAAVSLKAARAVMLEKQFSGWDGSHPRLEAEVKRSMKNPASYEHVETRFTDTGKGMRVSMVFRGTNSFGAVVPNRVVALLDDSGNVLEIANGRDD